MAQAQRDLGTRLDWVAVDHWNTGHPHVHVIIRGRANDGQDLVISRDYIREGMSSARAQNRRSGGRWRERSRPSVGRASTRRSRGKPRPTGASWTYGPTTIGKAMPCKRSRSDV
jgi:type IV secretory pathway VirD2 relaxase